MSALSGEDEDNVVPFPTPKPDTGEQCPPDSSSPLCRNTLQAKVREIPWHDPLHDKILPSPIIEWFCEYTCPNGRKFSKTIRNRLGCPKELPAE
jgi:hypothetical protein